MYARIGSVLAGVVKLVDALDSKSSGPWPVSVRVRPSASETPPKRHCFSVRSLRQPKFTRTVRATRQPLAPLLYPDTSLLVDVKFCRYRFFWTLAPIGNALTSA